MPEASVIETRSVMPLLKLVLALASPRLSATSVPPLRLMESLWTARSPLINWPARSVAKPPPVMLEKGEPGPAAVSAGEKATFTVVGLPGTVMVSLTAEDSMFTRAVRVPAMVIPGSPIDPALPVATTA